MSPPGGAATPLPGLRQNQSPARSPRPPPSREARSRLHFTPAARGAEPATQPPRPFRALPSGCGLCPDGRAAGRLRTGEPGGGSHCSGPRAPGLAPKAPARLGSPRASLLLPRPRLKKPMGGRLRCISPAPRGRAGRAGRQLPAARSHCAPAVAAAARAPAA